jgi:hypothetical protein
MEKIVFSQHCLEERQDRIVRIASTIGFGNVIAKVHSSNRTGATVHCLTDTGVVIVKDSREEMVITLFVCNIDRLYAYWRKMGQNKPPRQIMKVVENNERKRKFLYEI